MNAVIVAVGSEMLTPFRVDTNSLLITERLNAVGYDVRMKLVVGDGLDDLLRALTLAIGRADLVICTGGLGPTEDDLTRDALATLLGVPLDVDQAILEAIRARFVRRGLTMPAINERQAQVPRGAVVLPNTNGTAPGLLAEREGTTIVLLPGPPREMQPMLDALIAARFAASGAGLFRRVLRITGRSESDVDATTAPVYKAWAQAPIPISTTILASMGQIELHLTAIAPERRSADAALDAAVAQLVDVLGLSVYSIDGRPLEHVVGDLLAEAGWTIAVAESCTGGLLASRITDVAGSSRYFLRGVVSYSNEAKTDLLGVPADLIDVHGAVSEPVALAMARGIRASAGSVVGVGITGIAGPGGGTAAKPVGTVAVAVVAPGAEHVRTWRFLGSRDLVKFQSAQAALDLVRRLLLARHA
ncbi:MAG: competence/damage-inducible protein A [Vicinamibacterales bacterium]